MSSLTQAHINPPQDWQAFERASAVLWSCILDDPSVHRFGRQGQAQYGLDLTGYRDGNANKFVGIQCKCINPLGELSEDTVLNDLKKAANYEPLLTEYFITTTAENDAKLDQLAHKLTREFADNGRNLIVRIWGWGTLQENIQNHQKAIDAFDPHHSPSADEMRSAIETLGSQMQEGFNRQEKATIAIESKLGSPKNVPPHFLSQHIVIEEHDAPDHAELDRYRELINEGKPKAALLVIEAKESSLSDGASNTVRSRLKALAAHCYWHLGEDERAIQLFQQASDIAPQDKRGIAARVLGHVLISGIPFEARI